MNSKVLEIFGANKSSENVEWNQILESQQCPFLSRKCIKVRKSQPEVAIGTCTVKHGKGKKNIVICPHRLLERHQIFTDCLHLLTLHEPGNELHLMSEISVPGGSVDYFLVSLRERKVRDFVGIELQTLDTTGTVWPERQKLLAQKGISVPAEDIESAKNFGINWKMTAKTILVQLHHKIETFENINKHLVVVVQDHLMEYMKGEFSFGHLNAARLGDSMHMHSYTLKENPSTYRLDLSERRSTDAKGISACLGLQADPIVALEDIIVVLESKISDDTVLRSTNLPYE